MYTNEYNGRRVTDQVIREARRLFPQTDKSREVWPDFGGILRYDPKAVTFKVDGGVITRTFVQE